LKYNIKVALKETGRIWVDTTDSGYRPVAGYCAPQEIINFPYGYATQLIYIYYWKLASKSKKCVI